MTWFETATIVFAVVSMATWLGGGLTIWAATVLINRKDPGLWRYWWRVALWCVLWPWWLPVDVVVCAARKSKSDARWRQWAEDSIRRAEKTVA
jgi:hypothetical protein